VPARQGEEIHASSGLNATLSTQLVCPRKLWIFSVTASQTLTVASVLPQASSRLSGLNARLSTPPVESRSSPCGFHVSVSQNLMVQSEPAPEARSFPSGRKATQVTTPVWARGSCLMPKPVAKSQTLTDSSALDVAA